MYRPLAFLAATTMVTGLLATAAPVTAQAAECDDPANPISSGYTTSVALGVKKARTSTLNLYTFDGCQVDGVTASVAAPRGTTKIKLTKGTAKNGLVHWQGKIKIKPTKLRNSDAGNWPVTFTATGDQVDAETVPLEVKRLSRLTFNAGPEPVRDNKITFAGKADRASWNSHRYVAWSNQRVEISVAEGDDGGEGLPEQVAETTSNASGAYRLTTKFFGANEYYAQTYSTDTTLGVSSSSDHVK